MLNILNNYKKNYLTLLLMIILLMIFSTSLSFVYGEPSIKINGSAYLLEKLSVSTTGINGTPTYQWSSSSDGVVFNDIEGATSSTYTLTQNEVNKYMKVTITDNGLSYSKVTDDVVKIAFYLDKGNITISSSSGYKGYDKNGNVVSGSHNDTNKYVVTQTDSSVVNANGISLVGILKNCDITIDGINTNKKDSISMPASGGKDKNVVIRLKGTNTVNNILYYTSEQTNSPSPAVGTSTLKFTSSDGDGSINGSLNIAPVGTSARWGAGIGGNDSYDAVTGLTIAGGTFNVITDRTDDCTAIGAGGNGYVTMKITGGKIYAENASTGATIGGGLGYDSIGGGGIVEITGGEIEAINHGNNYYSTDVYGVAIGGGGSRGGYASDVKVIISGGKIKATVPAGATAIGAGNSTLSYGGKATIDISGGEIIAKGNIGGGSVMGNNSYNGGSSTVSVSGGFINVDGNIGGGSATQGNGGYSEVSITGGTIASDSIGGGYSVLKGYNSSKVTITGGSLNSKMSTTPTNGTENVYLTPSTFYNSNSYYKNSLVKTITGVDYYGMNDVKTDDNGKLYFWIPNTSVITEATDTDNNLYSGVVPSKSQGVLKYNTTMNFYTIKLLENPEYYELYLDKNLEKKYNGTLYKTANSTFTFYLDKNADSEGNSHKIDVYVSTADDLMKKLNPKSINGNVEEYQFNISTYNVEVWFVVTDKDKKILKLDLNSGDMVLSKNSNTNNLDVVVGNNKLLNYDGRIILSSFGISTSNIMTLVSGNADVFISNLIASGNRSVVNVHSGTLRLESDSYDNQVTSTNAPAIFVEDEANIIVENGNSLKVTSSTGSAIGGNGSITLSKYNGAHLDLKQNSSFSQITANKYTYITNSLSDSLLPYSLTLPNLIGYHNSKDNKLYDLRKKYTVSESTTFKATSLTTILKDLTETHEIDSNGNLKITFSSVPASITVLRDGVVLDSSSWMSGNVLTIPASEAYYNLSIDATNYFTYSYVTTEFDDFYDGEAHSVNVDVTNIDNVDVYYSTSLLDSSNYATIGSKIAPKLINVGNLPVYFYIPQGIYNGNVYREISGVLNINVKKADNRWNLSLGIPSVVQGMPLKPLAHSRWGEPVYTYYKYNDGTYTEIVPSEAGIYFVKAYVEGTDNYNPLESDYVMFNIESTALIKSTKGRFLTKVVDGSRTTEIPKDGIISTYVAFRYTPNETDKVTFEFSDNLPLNTKITLIDFNSTTPVYYKYDVTSTISNVALGDFIKMGTTDTHLVPRTSGGEFVAEFQLVYDFSETTNNLSHLNTVIHQGSGQILETHFDITFSGNYENSILLETITNERGKMSIPVVINANDTYLKTLEIKLTDESGNDIALPIGITAELLSSDGTKYYGFVRKNSIFISLNRDIIENEEYTLILDNLSSNKYKVNVKMYENNKVVSNSIVNEVIEKNSNSIYVKDLLLNQRFIDNNSTIQFNVKYKTETETEVLVYKSMKKDGVYGSKELVKTIPISNLFGQLDIPITINQDSGVWRYYFQIGNSIDVYNIIVK